VANFNVWRATVVHRGVARNLTVHAVCVPAGLGLTYGHETRTYGTDAGAFNFTIACPTGVPISGGARWEGMQRQVAISTSGPVDASGNVNSIPDAAWSVATTNFAGSPKDITAFVICKPA
jgi:hypothetical protein